MKKWVCAGGAGKNRKPCDYSCEQVDGVLEMYHPCGVGKRRTPMKLAPGEEKPETACRETKSPVASTTRKPKISREDKDMATKRAAPKTAATKAKAPAAPKVVTTPDAQRHRKSYGHRGWLAEEVEKVLRKTPTETVPVGEIVKKITNSEGEHPSTGAVAAVINRWAEGGYIKVKTSRPLSFNGYTARWASKDLDAYLAAQKTKRAKARAAAAAQ